VGDPEVGDRRGLAEAEDAPNVGLGIDGARGEAGRQAVHGCRHHRRPMLRILRQPNFARLWFGGLISMTGDWILITGLPFEIYRLTGSTTALGFMAIAFMIPSITLGSVAGVFVDRWDRRRLMLFIDIALA